MGLRLRRGRGNPKYSTGLCGSFIGIRVRPHNSFYVGKVHDAFARNRRHKIDSRNRIVLCSTGIRCVYYVCCLSAWQTLATTTVDFYRVFIEFIEFWCFFLKWCSSWCFIINLISCFVRNNKRINEIRRKSKQKLSCWWDSRSYCARNFWC